MGWSSEEEETTKRGMEKSSKILLGIIACVVLIILLIVIMLLNIKFNAVIIYIDAKEKVDYDINKLVSDIDGLTYIDIEEFASLIDYEYHKGEYKSFSNEEDKCYVIGKNETATFYLNENKINKLPVDSQFEEEYREYTVKDTIKIKNEKMYASIEAISIAFNVKITKKDNIFNVDTLNYLIQLDNDKVKKWGYSDITTQSFENQKALLYDRLIVKKENGLYKIINRQNTEEIIPDKYINIEFLESKQQFFVTNALGQVGIINIDGDIEIEPIYDSISTLDKEKDLYIVQQNDKYGIVKGGNIEIISPKYEGIGCDITSVEVDKSKKTVNPVTIIDKCEGIVVKNNDKYGVIDIKGNIIVPIQVDSIYSIKGDDEELEYFMIYNGKELNIIDMLIEQGLIKSSKKEEDIQENENNTVQENINTMSQENNNVTTNSENLIINNLV